MKRKVKVFSYPSHCDGKHVPGVDYARIIRPMEELGKQDGFKVEIFDGKKKMDWRDIAKEFDVLYLNYITNAWGFVTMAVEMAKNGKKIVYDIDDSIWDIQKDNAAYHVYEKGSENTATITDIIARGCDYATVTNQFLKNAVAHHTGKNHNNIKVFQNYIDLDLYKWKQKQKDKYNITIAHFGSSSHFNDLANDGFVGGMEKLMKEFPQVNFFTVGALIPSLKTKFGHRYTTGFGDHDIYKWVKMMPLILQDVDIFVAPLVDTTYCRSKSSIKYLEYSSAQIPGVYQYIRQYREVVEHGKNGFLAATSNDWYSSLKELVESKQRRIEVGMNAYKDVKSNWTIQKNVKEYVDFFNEIVYNK